MRQFELVEKVKSYDPSADEDLLNRAYVFGIKAHGNQKRDTGDPYFSHPLEVAGILTDLKLDEATIVTAMLHDTIEDTDVTHDDIEKNFGPEIADLVDGVTKLSKIELQSEETKQAENFRKFMLAMSHDVRVLLVKLADRLHNMRTLQHMSDEGKRRISRETMEIYAPIANRLGLNELFHELQELAFSHMHPLRYRVLAQEVADMGIADPSPRLVRTHSADHHQLRAAEFQRVTNLSGEANGLLGLCGVGRGFLAIAARICGGGKHDGRGNEKLGPWQSRSGGRV